MNLYNMYYIEYQLYIINNLIFIEGKYIVIKYQVYKIIE